MNRDVENYFRQLPRERAVRLKMLHDLLLSLYPAVSVDMKYRMPTYTLDDGWVAIANQKQYVSLYTCSAEHLAVFKQKHPDIKSGKGCINFRDRDEMPLDDLEQVIEHAIRRPKGH